jgi:hypothetical protein
VLILENSSLSDVALPYNIPYFSAPSVLATSPTVTVLPRLHWTAQRVEPIIH